MNKETFRQLTNLQSHGVTFEDARALRRISLTLRSWFTLECGDSNDYSSWAVERDEETDKPYRVVHTYRPTAQTKRYLIADRETGARKRLVAIMARYPHLSYYVQTDPRGSALYILRPGDVPENKDPSCYYSRGIALY